MSEDTCPGMADMAGLSEGGCREGGNALPENPRCDYVPRPGNPAHRCRRPAAVRVLYRHGTGVNPEYRERCLMHAADHLGPGVGALWDPLTRAWVGTD
jgi:hypothetical protein